MIKATFLGPWLSVCWKLEIKTTQNPKNRKTLFTLFFKFSFNYKKKMKKKKREPRSQNILLTRNFFNMVMSLLVEYPRFFLSFSSSSFSSYTLVKTIWFWDLEWSALFIRNCCAQRTLSSAKISYVFLLSISLQSTKIICNSWTYAIADN